MDDGLEPMDRGGVRGREEDPNAGPVGRERGMDADRDFERRQQLERDREFEKDRGSVDEDVRTDRDYKDYDRHSSDIEETRKFNKIEEQDDRDSDQRDNYVDGNIDSSDAVEPVTDEEYRRTHGMEINDER